VRPLRSLSVPLLLLVVVMAWVVEATATQLSLLWTDNADNEDGFKIERRSGATSCYRVRAFNGAGDSAYSNEACGTGTGSCTPTLTATTTVTATFTPQLLAGDTGGSTTVAAGGTVVGAPYPSTEATDLPIASPLTLTRLAADHSSPQPPGTPFIVTAAATGGIEPYQPPLSRRNSSGRPPKASARSRESWLRPRNPPSKTGLPPTGGGYVRAAGAGGAGPGGAGAPERARWVRMAWTARGSCTVAMRRSRASAAPPAYTWAKTGRNSTSALNAIAASTASAPCACQSDHSYTPRIARICPSAAAQGSSRAAGRGVRPRGSPGRRSAATGPRLRTS